MKLVVRIPGPRSSSIPMSFPTNSGRATLFMRPTARLFDSLISLSCPSTAIQGFGILQNCRHPPTA